MILIKSFKLLQTYYNPGIINIIMWQTNDRQKSYIFLSCVGERLMVNMDINVDIENIRLRSLTRFKKVKML